MMRHGCRTVDVAAALVLPRKERPDQWMVSTTGENEYEQHGAFGKFVAELAVRGGSGR
jgi:hypothetical protein